jgi:adenosylcobinamide-GDP ribazoletransferase
MNRRIMIGLAVREARALRVAALFFTRLPLPSLPVLRPGDERRSTTYWPLIGAGVGAAIACAWWLAAWAWPPGVAAAIALAVGLLLTGALHEDGFADVCDGLGGGRTRERALEIMRDSRIGAFGAIGLVMLLGLKWQAMAALPSAVLPGAVIAAHALSRGSLVAMTFVLPYARVDGRTAQRMAGCLDARFAGTVVLSLLPLLLLAPAAWPACVAAMMLVWAGGFFWFRRRLGGYTGDCLGATQQLGEVAVLLGVLAGGQA